MKSPVYLRFLALGASLSVLSATPHLALAQPDGGNRTFVVPPPPAPLPPLTLDEVQKLTGGPTLVTYSGQNVPVADAVKALLAAAGQDANRQSVQMQKDTPATISVDWKDKPFWDAAQEMEKLTGLSWTGFMGGMSLAPSVAGSTNLSGNLITQNPFVRIYSESVTHTKVSKTSLAEKTATATPQAQDTTQLVVKVYFDPKIKVQNGSLTALDIHIPDGMTVAQTQTQDMVPAYAEMMNNYILATGNGSLIQTLPVMLPRGILSDTVLTKVTATARVLAMVNSKQWQVDDLVHAADAQETNEKAQYTVDSVEVVGKQLKVHLMVEKDANDPDMAQPMPFRIGIPANALLNPVAGMAINGGMANGGVAMMRRTMAMGGRFGAFSGVTVKDANGKVLSLQGNSMSVGNGAPGQTQTKNEMTFDISDAVGPFSMTWDLPSKPRNIDTPFEFDGLKVP